MEKTGIIAIILISLMISGCITEGGDDEDENIEITHRETLFLENTEYGMTNVSYVIEEHGSGRDKETFVNISVKVEDEENKLNTINLKYWMRGGGGSGLYHDEQNNVHYLLIRYDFRYLDFWVLFYETGERRWDEYNSTYYYDSILKKALSFTLSRELDTGEDLSIIEIGDILWAFDEDDHEVFNVSFNVTSSSDIRDLEIHYVMTKDTGMYSSSFQEDGRIDERYVKSIRIASDYREEIDQLLFCLAASNMGGKRCTTEVFWVPLKDV